MLNKKTLGEKIFDSLNVALMCLLIIIMLFPFMNQIALSLSSNVAVLAGRVTIWPVDFSIEAYREVLSDVRFSRAFTNSVVYTILGLIMHVSMTALFAYPLSRKSLKGRNGIMNVIIFSMVFGTGGLIPNYLLIKGLGLVNSFWALWLPGMINLWQVIILKNFFQQIPESLHESAEIDGARPIRIFVQIIIPLSLPSIASISLFSAVSLWNTFFNAMIYLNDKKMTLLQVHLREVLQNYATPHSADTETRVINPNQIAADTIKAATLMCTTIPIVCIYPFLQKYFVKGVMVGAIKG